METFTEVVEKGFGATIMNSIKGVFGGFLLFCGSFALLWWNEGNLVGEKAAFDEMKAKVVKVSSAEPSGRNKGKLVHATGKLSSPEKLGDPGFIRRGPYLSLERQVEMFQWVERTQTRKEGSKEVKEYKYSQEWADGRVDSKRFRIPKGHLNPPLAVPAWSAKVKKAKFGKFDGLPVLAQLSTPEALPVTKKIVAAKTTAAQVGDKLYVRKDPASKTDKVGDVRLSYRVIRPGTFSVMAKQEGKSSFGPYLAKNGKEKFLVVAGTKAPENMIQQAKDSAGTVAMVLRVVGFLVMFFGITLILGPFTALLDFIPIVGSIGRLAASAVAFVLSALLSTVTIVLAMVLHNPIVLVLVAVCGLGGLAFLLKSRADKRRIQRPNPPEQQAAA